MAATAFAASVENGSAGPFAVPTATGAAADRIRRDLLDPRLRRWAW
jgi:hypothetical protein